MPAQVQWNNLRLSLLPVIWWTTSERATASGDLFLEIIYCQSQATNLWQAKPSKCWINEKLSFIPELLKTTIYKFISTTSFLKKHSVGLTTLGQRKLKNKSLWFPFMRLLFNFPEELGWKIKHKMYFLAKGSFSA